MFLTASQSTIISNIASNLDFFVNSSHIQLYCDDKYLLHCGSTFHCYQKHRLFFALRGAVNALLNIHVTVRNAISTYLVCRMLTCVVGVKINTSPTHVSKQASVL